MTGNQAGEPAPGEPTRAPQLDQKSLSALARSQALIRVQPVADVLQGMPWGEFPLSQALHDIVRFMTTRIAIMARVGGDVGTPTGVIGAYGETAARHAVYLIRAASGPAQLNEWLGSLLTRERMEAERGSERTKCILEVINEAGQLLREPLPSPTYGGLAALAGMSGTLLSKGVVRQDQQIHQVMPIVRLAAMVTIRQAHKMAEEWAGGVAAVSENVDLGGLVRSLCAVMEPIAMDACKATADGVPTAPSSVEKAFETEILERYSFTRSAGPAAHGSVPATPPRSGGEPGERGKEGNPPANCSRGAPTSNQTPDPGRRAGTSRGVFV